MALTGPRAPLIRGSAHALRDICAAAGSRLSGDADRMVIQLVAAMARRSGEAQALTSADVISFDIFDTLVRRRLDHPYDVHDLVRERAYVAGIDDMQDWRAVRLQAEAVARQSSRGTDVTLHEIYECLANLMPADTLAALRELELDAEQSVAFVTRRGKELFEAALARGQIVVITSDMYLPRPHIEQMLRRLGLDGWERLYLSGDDGIAKFNGSSFRSLTRDYPGRRVLHVGENLKHDVLRARAEGVEAMWLPAVDVEAQRTGTAAVLTRRFGFRPAQDLQASLIAGLVSRWLDARQGCRGHAMEEMGYSALGPLLMGFSQYLHETARALGVSKLVFLAREGAVLMRAYAAALEAEALESDYARLSTRVLGVARMTGTLGPADIRFLTKTPVRLPAAAYLTRILPELPPERVTAALVHAGVRAKQPLTRFEAAARLGPAFAHVMPDLSALADAQSEALLSYLRSLGLDGPGVALVDVGWLGTIQADVAELMGRATTGIYVSAYDSEVSRERSGVHAWADGRRGGFSATAARRLHAACDPLETLLAHPLDGTARSLYLGPNGVECECLPNEFSEAERVDISAAQDAALEFVADYRDASRELHLQGGSQEKSLWHP